MKNIKHKKLAIRSNFGNELKWMQLPFLRFTLSVTNTWGGTPKRDGGSARLWVNFSSFLKALLMANFLSL